MRYAIFATVFSAVCLYADDIDRKYPLDPQLAVLARDVASDAYRKLVLEKMLITDIAAEWQRVATVDNADSFLEKHGGKEKVLADQDLKAAYERRVKIRDDFLGLMRQGYQKYKKDAPFDKGVKAEMAGTQVKSIQGASVGLIPVQPCPDAEKNWPRFRGPTGQGDTFGKPPVGEWDKAGKNILWRAPVPGRGHSSPIVWGDRIFLTTAEEKGSGRAVLCYSRTDGKLLWKREVPPIPAEAGLYPKNSWASSTSVTDGERVISFFGAAGLICHDLDGNQLWHNHDFKIRTSHGTGSSPVMYQNLVILAQDQNQSESLFLALDKYTGKLAWKGDRSKAMTWCTPIIVRVGDHDELVMAGAEEVKGYDPKTGAELWSLKGPTQEVVPAIVVGPELIYSASGRNGPTLALRPGGKGDVTETHLAWRAVRGGPHVPSPILVGKRLYTANDTGVVTCLNADTGKLVFQERISDRFSASPVYAGGLLYCAAESGMTYVLKPGDSYQLVAKNDLGKTILASPAVIDGTIYIRTEDELIAIGIK